MFLHRVDAYPAAHPDFIGVVEDMARVTPRGLAYALNFVRQPAVVRIEQCDPVMAGGPDPAIACRAAAAIRLADNFDVGKQLRRHRGAIIAGTVVDEDDFIDR